MSESTVAVSAPGRICLFGEHQDYLGLPVIPSAISLRVGIRGEYRNDMTVNIQLPDIGSSEQFSLSGPLVYEKKRDYFRSAVNVIRRHGFTFSKGIDCEVRGKIPINTGTSSSSALIVAWVNLLARMSDQKAELERSVIAKYAHETEVLEFGEPGGMMDHYSTALGKIIFLEFTPETKVTPLSPTLGTFVLGDSGEPKDTVGILSRVKDQVIRIAKQLSSSRRGFSLTTSLPEEMDRFENDLSKEQSLLLRGTLKNHRMTKAALEALNARTLDHRRIGSMLSEHHAVLRDALHISTPKIDRMIDAACSAGALGGKINGSGGGGCMFVYAPERADHAAEAIERAGGKAYIVSSDSGTRLENGENIHG